LPVDLTQCTTECNSCIKKYIFKHKLEKGSRFSIPCNGIPREYLPPHVYQSLGEEAELAIAMLDPVTWAGKYLDWHCLDPDGSVWKRKTEAGTLPPDALPYNEALAKIGKSIFNRPYQAEALRCSSKNKVFRMGRQIGKSEVLCILILYNLWIHENYRIVIIAPFQSQVEMLFGRLADFIKRNPILENAVARSVKAPSHTIQLHNRSLVIGFTAGTKSGQNAGSARGQPANMLLFDEADYLASGDMQSALATTINSPGAQVVMSSTPTGRREHFFKTCHDTIYREFFYPSQVNPNWNETTEEFFRSQYTEVQFAHEILAEFGDQEQGVYHNKYIEAAQSDYEYVSQKRQQDWIYTMGVDWNDFKIGTTIAVIGYDTKKSMFYLVDKHIINRGERTQLVACQKIAELNRLWNCNAIYVDKGFSSGQVEVLHEYGGRMLREQGGQHPDARLLNIVKPFDFGGTIEVRDLFTGKPVKKNAKPFLVENSIRRFESCVFKYPKSDVKFTAALQGYVVKHETEAGRPVYEQTNIEAGDHFLDAVNLALIAFTLEETRFGKPRYSTQVNFAGGTALDGISPSLGEGSRVDVPADNVIGLARPERADTHRGSIDSQTLKQPNTLSGKVPVANTNNQHVKLWSWPGWERDTPKPVKPSFGGKYTPSVGRPKRAKF